MINIIASSRYKVNRKLLKKTAGEILSDKGVPENTVVNLVFVGKKKMKSISAKYKKENVALPVLSFNYSDSAQTTGQESVLGEVFVCYPQAVLLAAERVKKVDDLLVQLVVHGVENVLK